MVCCAPGVLLQGQSDQRHCGVMLCGCVVGWVDGGHNGHACMYEQFSGYAALMQVVDNIETPLLH